MELDQMHLKTKEKERKQRLKKLQKLHKQKLRREILKKVKLT
jgi:hypothetical protein